MAINPETQYPGKVAPSTPSYPYGAAQNITTPGDGTGTPWEAALVNDLFGFLQAILSDAGTPPSGTPDTAQLSQYLDGLKRLVVNSPRKGVTTDAISCIPRCVGGVFQLLDDAGHTPLGVDSVTQPDDYTIRINYSKNYDKINSLLITTDDALAPYGVTTGGDVGTGLANFKGYANLTGLLEKSGAGGTFTPHALFDPSDVTVDYTDDVLTITHDAAVGNDVPNVDMVFNAGLSPRIGVGYSGTKITVQAIVDLAGLVWWNGAAFEFRPGFPTQISPTQGGISFSESGGVLTVNHPLGQNYDIQVSPFGGSAYNVKVDNIGLASFDVRFYDTATGAQINVADANMQVFIKRRLDLKGVIPDGAQFLVRGPRLPIKSANFSNVPGNNFWITGILED